MTLTADAQELHIEAIRLAPSEEIPNSTLPLLLYRGVLNEAAAGSGALADAFEALFCANDWPGAWRNGIFPFHHYHSRAHEVLGIFEGHASVRFGGPGGVTLDVTPGDLVVIPAGVGHKRVAVRGVLGVVGAYPRGQHPDTCRSGEGIENIASVMLPACDPVYGKAGPLFTYWT